MDPQTTLADVRRLITEAKNEAAAQRLLAYLEEAAEPQRSWRDTVSNLLAQYKRVRLQQERGIVGFDDARLAVNQITDGLLAALAGIEGGLPAPVVNTEDANQNKPKTPWLAIGVVLALVLAATSFLMLRNMFGQDHEQQKPSVVVQEGEVEAGECPEYDEKSEFNILVLPFLPLDNKQQGIDRSIRIRLAERMEDYGVYGNVFSQKIDVNSNDYPITSRQAAELAAPCGAQLVIWGTTEDISEPGETEILTTTKFRFIESEHFSLTGLELTDNAEVDTVSTLSSIATNAALTGKLEMSLRLIFGLVAHETENHALAAELLDTVITERGGVAVNPKWGLIQADSYIKSGQDQKAIEVYERMQTRDSVNVQALLQKGLLEYRAGQSVTADKDLSMVLKQDPDNETALTARAVVSLDRNDLYQADQDLSQLERMQVRMPITTSIRANYQQKHQQEQQKYKEAEEQIRENPNDTSAWRIKAETAQNLGQFQQAGSAANQLLTIDPKNVAALSALHALTPFLPDSVQIRERIRQTLPRLSPQQIRTFRAKTPE